MKIKNILISILLFMLIHANVSASLWSIKLFNIVEFNFYNNYEEELSSICTDDCYIEDIEEELIEEEIILPKVTYISDPIDKITFVNDKVYMYLSDFDFNISKNTLYINWYMVNKSLTKERHYSDDNYNVYSLDEDDISSYIFNWYNKIYFKNVKTYNDTIVYYYYYWDLFEYDGVSNLIKCNWNLDKIILKDWSWDEIYNKDNLWKYHNITYKRDYEELKKWYYNAEIYCSNPVKDLYFIWNFTFNYNSRYDQATHYTSYGEYYDETQYNILKK